MKLITFLGANVAYETIYVFPDGREHSAPFFGVALSHFYPGLTALVFVTQKARASHLDRFVALVEPHVNTLTPIDIPDGANEAGLWAIFQQVIDAVDEGESVIFDITHGFRSIPFLSFLAAAYLRVVKHIDLHAVLYGNYEARYGEGTPSRAPVIDLTPFVSLLDWMIAADRFVRFGDARDLAARLEATKPDYHDEKAAFQAWRETGIGRTVKTLEQLSLALRFIRPHETMEASDRLQVQFADAVAGMAQFAHPVQPLTKQITASYAPLALNKTLIERNPAQALRVERNMVHWYVERNQFLQAVALAREWIVSWAMLHLGMSDSSARAQRELVEEAFRIELLRVQGNILDESNSVHQQVLGIAGVDKAIALYGRLGDLRNDLLHAGKRANPRPSKTLARDAPKLCRGIDQLQLDGDSQKPDSALSL